MPGRHLRKGGHAMLRQRGRLSGVWAFFCFVLECNDQEQREEARWREAPKSSSAGLRCEDSLSFCSTAAVAAPLSAVQLATGVHGRVAGELCLLSHKFFPPWSLRHEVSLRHVGCSPESRPSKLSAATEHRASVWTRPAGSRRLHAKHGKRRETNYYSACCRWRNVAQRNL